MSGGVTGKLATVYLCEFWIKTEVETIQIPLRDPESHLLNPEISPAIGKRPFFVA